MSTTVKNDPGDRRALLQQALAAVDDMRARLAAQERQRREPIAIVGMACRYPGGADTPQALWEVLRHGRDAVTDVPADRWDPDAYYDARPGTPGRMVTKRGGFLSRVDLFDPEFFGISPREAVTMDPQQRLLLETTWEAIEHAGCAASSLAGSDTGVFVGITTSDYRDIVGVGRPDQADVYAATGNALNAASGRLAFTLGLHGPCASIDTACSSSLVAVHLACQSLRAGDCGLALAGGVNLVLRPEAAILFSKWGMLAPDGRCKTFDAAADGFVRSEGCGVLLLERLSDAIAHGRRILAVIRGSAVNQDGHSSGLTVPNGLAQQLVIRRALASAGVEASAVQYVEAHGTGTPIGDPIEIEALAAELGRHRAADDPLLIGSIKTNIGHAEAASGVAGLMKVVLALQEGAIPPHLHFERPNPRLAWDRLPLRVPTTLIPWPRGERPRLAGVSSFGFSGTNAHVILEEAPADASSGAHATPVIERPRHVFVASARTRTALRATADRLASHLTAHPEDSFADVCHTLAVGRVHFEHRLAVPAASSDEVVTVLRRVAAGEQADWLAEVPPNTVPKVAFLFTGQGAQYAGMARQLYESAPRFRAALDECASLLTDAGDGSLIAVLYPEAGRESPIDETRWTQPALFALEYALAMQWREWGIEPAVVLGHSVGEYVAATVAGALDLPDALRLVSARGRLMQALPRGGAMVAVLADEAAVSAAITPFAGRVAIAAINGPRETVVSGEAEAVEQLADSCRAAGMKVKALTVSHAFHSPLMRPMLAEFERIAQSVAARPPAIPLVSNVTGDYLDRGTPLDAGYWARHVLQPVRFLDSLRAVSARGITTFLEIGPAPVLSALATQVLPDGRIHALASLRKGRDEWVTMFDALAALHVIGVPIDWRGVDRDRPRRLVGLPTYPFQRERHWVDRRLDAPDATREVFLRSPANGEWFLQASVSAKDEVVADHVALGTRLYPAAGYLRLVWQAMAMRHPDAAIAIEGLVVHDPLSIEGDRTFDLQVVLSAESSGQSAFAIYSAEQGRRDAPWVKHASGRASVAPGDPPDADVAAWRARCQEAGDVTAFYRTFAANGIEYGPAYRRVTEVHRGAGEAVVRVAMAPGADTHWPLAAMSIDALFQSVAAASPTRLAVASDDEMWVPVAFGRIVLSPRLWRATECWSAARIDSAGSGEHGTLRADVSAFGDGGEALLTVTGLSARFISRAALQRSLQRGTDDLLYDVQWQAVDAPADRAAGSWLVVGSSTGAAGALARRIVEREGSAVVIEDLGAPPSLPSPVDGVVDVSALDVVDDGDVAARAEAGVLALQGCARLVASLREGGTDVPVVVATRGACAVEADAPVDPAQAALWGFARAARAEQPQQAWRLVDVDPQAAPADWIESMVSELARPGADEPEIALRPGGGLAPRLRRISRDGDTDAIDLPDGPYELTVGRRGRLDSIQVVPAADAVVGPGEVEIEVSVSGLNFRDVLNVLGMYPGDPGHVGSECVGRVRAVGSGVRRVRPGDRVVAIADRAFASFVIAREVLVQVVPPGMTDEQAATIPNAYLTADHALNVVARVGRGERVLVHAGTGGVGLAAVHLARAAGAQVFATAGSDRKRAYLRSIGVAHVMDSRSASFADDLRAVTGGDGVDVVLNSLTGALVDASLGVLRSGGRFVELGKTDVRDAASVSAEWSGVSYSVMDLGEVFRADPAAAERQFTRVMQAIADGALPTLPVTRFDMRRVREAFRFMAQARHIGKVVVAHAPMPGRFRLDATYVVTGAFGGLGLATAQWMVAQGARHLVLIGRSRPDAKGAAALGEFARGGVAVDVVNLDVSRFDELAGALDAVPADRPIRGIVHAAGVLADDLLPAITPERVRAVFAPKADGAWNLHRWASGASLDFFVLYGAGAGLLGSPGQASYAAANAFLDGLAHLRRAEGTPAVSVDWGPWAEVGMAAAAPAAIRQRWEATGLGTIMPAQGVLALEAALRVNRAQIAVLPIDWGTFARQAGGRVPAIVGELARAGVAAPRVDATAPAGEGDAGDLATLLADTPAVDRDLVLHAQLKIDVARVLGLAPGAEIHPRRGLMELGMDSLMAVDLGNRLQHRLGRAVSPTVVFEHPTIEELARHLLALLGLDGPGGSSATVVPHADLTDEAVERALLSELEQSGY